MVFFKASAFISFCILGVHWQYILTWTNQTWDSGLHYNWFGIWIRFVPLLPKYQFLISSYIMGLNCSTHMVCHPNQALRIGPNIGHFDLFTSFIQILLISQFWKKSEFLFGQVWATKFKFQLRCKSISFKSTMGYG